MEQVFAHKYYDVFYDDLAYCAGDVRTVLEAVPCRRYVMVSSASVYDLHFQTVETDYEPEHDRLVWYTDYSGSYDVLKKSAECALVQQYPMKNAAFVRFPTSSAGMTTRTGCTFMWNMWCGRNRCILIIWTHR